jgi:hypothetical protein
LCWAKNIMYVNNLMMARLQGRNMWLLYITRCCLLYSDTIWLICCVLTVCICEYTHNFIHCIFKHFSVEHRAWSNYVEELSIVILPAWLVLNLLLRFRDLLLHVVKYSFFWKLLTNLKSRKRERSNSPENVTFWGHHPNLFRILLHLLVQCEIDEVVPVHAMKAYRGV